MLNLTYTGWQDARLPFRTETSDGAWRPGVLPPVRRPAADDTLETSPGAFLVEEVFPEEVLISARSLA